ncbi:phosphoenolpyruvate--protein phosphotransferase [Desulfovibrio subterraneus]|uniref:Phosphoenolpyruvate-protein phosphotransferase n=1 Tax=Desulfovibrio subterraneus TaxID=2718620 RepID=A0A7J0BGJ1_9BACT|nr:phosphoenolpyruvate--protein phosphotransferase [Desulfovibrio subterraneus]WBF67093.1 phosphoenolpyruvate--protein phosphotransferase [Desulfovibrio subterraneus]GFM32829.1 phosphoenolpyruvate-protein phosphotransferase [Desulfovibrio subterraneus]
MAREILHGVAVSAGISIGKAFFINRQSRRHIPRETIPASKVDYEIDRLTAASNMVRDEFEAARAKVPEELREHGAIIDSHLMICQDPKLMLAAATRIRDRGITAEWALEQSVETIAAAFSAIDDPYIRERIQDVRVVAERIMQRLLGGADTSRALEERMVLMAHDLTPADTIELEQDKIMSFTTCEGGKTSHTGILARSLQIPAIVGVEGLEECVRDGELVIVDALRGRILIDPTEDELADYSDLKYQFENYQKSIIHQCKLPGETVDGFRLDIQANIELADELQSVLDNGGEGVGLYRTEYAFLNRKKAPTEEELYREYATLAERLAPAKVTLRTLDVGADKMMNTQEKLEEANPALGLRGIRYCLKNLDLFRMQLRAILRASVHGNVAVMFPMISGIKEVRQARYQLNLVRQELDEAGIPYNPNMPVGIMIELPSAVMISETLAQEVDFFSIGTNDLIQYSLGIDRANKHVSYLYQPLHPAIVRSIKYVVDAAHRAGIEVSVCGEVASDPYCIPILMGMQIDAVSIAPQAIPGIKRIIRQVNMEECKQLLRDVLSHATVSKINRKVRQTIFKRFPEELTFFASLLDQDD